MRATTPNRHHHGRTRSCGEFSLVRDIALRKYPVRPSNSSRRAVIASVHDALLHFGCLRRTVVTVAASFLWQLFSPQNGHPTLHSSRRRAVRWPAASAARFSATLRVALPGTGGTARLSERTLGGPGSLSPAEACSAHRVFHSRGQATPRIWRCCRSPRQ